MSVQTHPAAGLEFNHSDEIECATRDLEAGLIKDLQEIRDALGELWDSEHPNCEQHTRAMVILDHLIKNAGYSPLNSGYIRTIEGLDREVLEQAIKNIEKEEPDYAAFKTSGEYFQALDSFIDSFNAALEEILRAAKLLVQISEKTPRS